MYKVSYNNNYNHNNYNNKMPGYLAEIFLETRRNASDKALDKAREQVLGVLVEVEPQDLMLEGVETYLEMATAQVQVPLVLEDPLAEEPEGL